VTDATAAETIEAEVEETEAQTEGERDFESEARAMGWRPQEEFSGDPKQFIDAKTFVERGEQFLPILKAQNKNLVATVRKLERGLAEATEFFSKAEQRSYERALAELKAQQLQAVETGDVQAFKAVEHEIGELQKETAAKMKTAAAGDDAETLQEALIEWRAENSWYQPDAADPDRKLMSDYADLVARKMGARETLGMQPREYLDAIAEKVRERFPKHFAKPGTQPKAKTTTEAPTRGSGKPGGKTFADLPAEAQRQADRFVKVGVLKSRDDYVKSYAW